MSVVSTPATILDEIAEFIASRPTREEILAFHPSAETQQRARDLLNKLKGETLSSEEVHELDQFEQAELLMRLVKAKLRDPGRS